MILSHNAESKYLVLPKNITMEGGWDPEVKKYFRKVLNSISIGLLWMMTMVTTGLYFGLAYTDGRPIIYNILFYVFLVTSLGLLLWYYYKTWKKDP